MRDIKEQLSKFIIVVAKYSTKGDWDSEWKDISLY
jgi:hypothetical protein